MVTKKVDGANSSHKVFLYTLSTCGWCKKTKQLLKDNDIQYEYLDLDTASKEERNTAISELKEKEVPIAFPVIIIDDEEIISGFKEKNIKEALNI